MRPGPTGLAAYGAVTAAYWAFMLTRKIHEKAAEVA